MLNMKGVNEIMNIYEERIKHMPKEKNDKLYKELDLSVTEMMSFQNAKSVLFASNRMTLDVANFIYRKLRDYAKTSLSERIVLTLLHKECLELRRKL